MTGVRIGVSALLLSILISWVGCATVSAPTGGPKDSLPPAVRSTSFPNGEPNFNEKSIIIEFDEFIKLQSGGQDIYSSPPLGDAVSFVAKKNKLFVIFQEELEPNTTYHINFGKSIQDVNESNAMNNYQFVFATGEKIDSLSFSGRITSQEEDLISESTLIGLYPELDDSAFVKGPPFYFTFVEQDGSFKLEYLKGGTYQAFALKDANNNFYYDLPNEAIGFADSAIALNTNVAPVSMELFLPESKPLRVKSFDTKTSNYQLNYELSSRLPIADEIRVQVKLDSQYVEPISQLDKERLNLTIWLDCEIDSLTQFESVVQINDQVIDTFSHSVSKLKKPSFEISLLTPKIGKNDSLVFESSNPIVQVQDKFSILDSLSGDTIASNPSLSTDFQLFVLPGETLDKNVVYTLLRGRNAVTDLLGQESKVAKHKFEIVSKDARGTIIFQFEEADSLMHYLLELKNENDVSISTLNLVDSKETWTIPNLEPGNYVLSIIEDQDQNGVWNSGTLFPRSLPEKKYNYSKTLSVRANWEVEETINLNTP